MKKMTGVLVALMVLSVFVAVPTQAKETGGAGPAVLSLFFPGVGEWSNNDFKGGFPVGECIVGAICFPFMISSVIDAAHGNTDTNMRFDFWSSPNAPSAAATTTAPAAK